MYSPRKYGFISKCYAWYFDYIFKKYFSGFNYSDITIKQDEAVLVLANRFSWWDGFMLFQLNKKVFKKQFYILVASNDYQQINYLKYFGAFAPESKGKDVITTLHYAGSLLDDPKNLVLIFPQGKIRSSHTANINFEKGVLQIINASKKKFQVVFSAILIDYLQHRKPKAEAYLTPWEAEEYISLQLLKSEYNKHYENSISKQSQKAG
ncbi:lysophospholipid acyltransferase family protein [Pedobacter sp. Du54]|uniref:lysophospholipid acyltransferase family protein n=1 Tax=Pedobacter anseongensis TaxID=3133439 RepID=UPI00309F0283